MVFECELHARDLEVGTSWDRNPGQDRVTFGRVHRPGSTNDCMPSLVRIQYHAPVIAPLLNPSQVPVNGGSNSRSASSVESSA